MGRSLCTPLLFHSSRILPHLPSQQAAGGKDQCQTIAQTAFTTLLAAGGNCAQQNAADSMISLAKTLNNSTDMITLAQIFVQQPRNAVRVQFSSRYLLPPIYTYTIPSYSYSPTTFKFPTARQLLTTPSSTASSTASSMAPTLPSSAAIRLETPPSVCLLLTLLGPAPRAQMAQLLTVFN